MRQYASVPAPITCDPEIAPSGVPLRLSRPPSGKATRSSRERWEKAARVAKSDTARGLHQLLLGGPHAGCDARAVGDLTLQRLGIGALRAYHDALVNGAAHVAAGQGFVDLVDRVVSAAESLPADSRPPCWILAGAALPDLDGPGRRGPWARTERGGTRPLSRVSLPSGPS
jgi:hypothetical protein